jgi:hypothetical protein
MWIEIEASTSRPLGENARGFGRPPGDIRDGIRQVQTSG